ncbi:MAG: glycoside hydrolase family 88 protein [Sphingobacteriales bacterium]|nr:glycoside hydrolase family 88 protein [Sphingobacteriales bacterium]OJW31783.1 MAG: glucuronyl hydrolase [Sphingobacteriales bacterium 46-32]
MKYLFWIGCTMMVMTGIARQTSPAPLSQQMARTAMQLWPDSFLLQNDKVAKWRYDQGVILKGVEAIWKQTGEGKWFDYIQRSMDFYVQNDGSIKGYKAEEYNIDHVNNGKLLLLLFQVTGKDKYRKAATLLRDQLRTHPRTSAGGFWHKKIYPSQMWLDGLYMGQPFYAEYASIFHDDTAFADITRQFSLMERNARDPKTGLLYHGWDESRAQQWADKQTGHSPNIWGRALGWYGMALVDALDYFPDTYAGRDTMKAILQRFAKAVTNVQDPVSGLWYDIPDKPRETGNYHEASASAMLVYTVAKGVRKGYLPASYLVKARKGYEGIKKEFLQHNGDQLDLKGTVSVSGLGGTPYRDGSFSYYMSEPVVVNDPKGIGAFILCATEMELLEAPKTGAGKTVLLDRFFNSEKRKDAGGKNDYWHYTWTEWSHPGFAFFGNRFNKYGAKLANLDVAPTAENLRKASVYIIVDPDHVKDNPQPNYMTPEYATVISNWVKAGGVLLLMGNDSANCELKQFNLLAGKFGISFTDVSRNMVKDDVFSMGEVTVPAHNAVFKQRRMFLKEISALSVKAPAKALIEDKDGVIMAVATYGKGRVLVVGDPWLYNEYVDGRRLPASFDNLGAADDLAYWLLKQAKK